MSDDKNTTDVETSIEKAESHSGTKKPNFTERGQPGIVTTSHFIQEARKIELKYPRFFCTVDKMYEDDAVYNSVDLTNGMVIQAMNDGKCHSSGTPSSDIAAEFINYCIRNMTQGTWLEAMTNASTDLKYGFSLLEIVCERRTYGPYKNQIVLKALSPRAQKTLQGWVWDKNNRYLKGFVQKPLLKSMRLAKFGDFSNGLTELSIPKFYETDYTFIDINKMLHFRYNPENNNPQGDSPLNHCFDAWMEKKLIEQYELSGVAKDLGGILVARSPSELFEKAANATQFPEAYKSKVELEKDLNNLHQGKSTFLHTFSDRDERGNLLYDVELKGVDGGGKQYKTSDIIKEKKKSIYNVFGTQGLLLGQDGGGGSHALATEQGTIFSYYVNKNLAFKEDVINNQLIPRLLAANDIFLDYKDMPKFKALNPFKLSHDEAGKFIQRVASVNKLTPQMLEWLLEDLGMEMTEELRKVIYEEVDYFDKGDSRSGESQGSSGTGDTQAGGSASENNMENGSSIDKSRLRVDGDKIIDTKTGDIINKDDLDEEGRYK